MSRTKHPRKRTPPRRRCRECGTHVYSWTEAPLCAACVRAVSEPVEGEESLREFRRRVTDPERNRP